jgi:hypothetical protein
LAPWRRCCNIANGCCLLLALPLTIPLIIVTVSVTDMVSFSTWVCLTYGAFFGLLFLFYENRHRKAGKKRDGSDKTWNDYLNGALRPSRSRLWPWLRRSDVRKRAHRVVVGCVSGCEQSNMVSCRASRRGQPS